MSAFLEIQSLGQRFMSGTQEHITYKDMNLTLDKGEFLCILGSSGCGKTTLLRTVGGFEKPTWGRVLVNGREITGPGRHCSMVFQTFEQLFPWKTIMGNVLFPLLNGPSPMPRREAVERAGHYLEMVGLTKFADYYPHQLSGGMKQRVAIARALAIESDLMLMDEPFASLDADTRTSLQKELVRIWDQTKITILFVTHSIIESIALGSKLMAMGEYPEGVKLFIDNPVKGERGKLRTPESEGYSECWAMLSRMIRK